MLSVILLSVLALTPSEELSGDARAILKAEAEETARNAQEFQEILDARFRGHVEAPQVGIFIDSAESPGPDGLHAITVSGVIAYSPGHRAGVLPGDRLISIGGRRIEHELPVHIYRMLISLKEPTPVTFLRNEEAFTVPLIAEIIACEQEAAQTLNTDVFRSSAERIHQEATEIANRRPVIEDIEILKRLDYRLLGTAQMAAQALFQKIVEICPVYE